MKDQKDKKWEAKKEVAIKKITKREESSPTNSTMLECKGTNPILQFAAPIDMSTMLSQMIVKIHKDKIPTIFSQEAQCSQGNNVWTMYFDGASSKEGAGVGVVFVSPNKETFRFSFTLTFICTNNIAEYEALLLGLKVTSKHNVKNLHGIGDSELVVQEVKVAYASKNKRLK